MQLTIPQNPMTTKNILVVGGAGYIGSLVNKTLHKAGYLTIVLDNLSSGRKEAIKCGTFILGDCGDSACLDTLFQTHSIDAVMHFAAYTNVGESVLNPQKYYTNNVINTLTLLNAMVRHGVQRFVFSSSAAIFGPPLNPGPIQETHPCRPINPYGETKWAVEKILRDYSEAYGLHYCNLRYFNAAGGDPEGEILSQNNQNLIPIILKNLRNRQKTTIFGTDYPTIDGTCVRDYIHIYDLAVAHLLALEKTLSNAPSSAYNLGNGQGFSIRQVIRTAESVLKQQIPVNEGPRRAGDPPVLVADAHKAHAELGWKPKYSDLESIISHAWKAFC